MTAEQFHFIVRRGICLLAPAQGDDPKRKRKMISFKKRPGLNRSSKYLQAAMILAAVTAIGTVPALAKKKHSLQGLHMSAENFDNHFDAGSVPISAKRAAAVHDCSVQASKFSNAS